MEEVGAYTDDISVTVSDKCLTVTKSLANQLEVLGNRSMRRLRSFACPCGVFHHNHDIVLIPLANIVTLRVGFQEYFTQKFPRLFGTLSRADQKTD